MMVAAGPSARFSGEACRKGEGTRITVNRSGYCLRALWFRMLGNWTVRRFTLSQTNYTLNRT